MKHHVISLGSETEPLAGVTHSSDGVQIHYDLYDRSANCLALVVPGFWRDRRHPSMRRLGPFLNALGFRAAILDVRGHGDSGGTYGFNRFEHRDVAAVAKTLVSTLPIDSIVLIGFSVGGAIAVSAAARHGLPISGILLISSVAEFSMIKPWVNPFALHRHIAVSQALRKPRFDWMFPRSEKLKASEDIASVTAPVCLIHVKNDWLIDHKHSVLLFERANEPKELHIIDIEGNYHADRVFLQAPETIEPLVTRFLTGIVNAGRQEPMPIKG